LLIGCSSIVIEHLEKKFKGEENVALACVYFNYKEITTTRDIFANLLKQLWEQNPNLSKGARELYQLHQKRETEPNVKELSPLLRIESCRVSAFFIVFDALDEFDDTQDARASILAELRQIPNVRAMITVRPHVQSTAVSIDNDVARLPVRASNSDIRTYLDSRIENMAGYLGELVKSDQDLRATIVEGIVSRADGMYNVFEAQISSL
jgi:hypothetical protein